MKIFGTCSIPLSTHFPYVVTMLLVINICLLYSYLDELGRAGEAGAEFLAMYKRLIASGHWKFYLALKGVLPRVGALITKVGQIM